MKQILFYFSLSILVASCATSYRKIEPNTVKYTAANEDQNIQFGYGYDLLQTKGNKRYANKESKRGIQVVAVEITNNADAPIVVAEQINFYAEDSPLSPIPPDVSFKALRQNTPIFLLYSLLFLNIDSNGNRTTIPIGVGIAAGNMAFAASSNSAFKKELQAYDILKDTIAVGETKVGLLTFRNTQFTPIRIEVERD